MIELCGFTLKFVRDMIRTYSQMHRTDKFSQHSSIIWPVLLNGWVFVYELSGCVFESRYSDLESLFQSIKDLLLILILSFFKWWKIPFLVLCNEIFF